MNLVDSCGWLEYFAEAKNAAFFAPAIEDPDSLVVPTICLYEVFKRVALQRGEHDALRAVAVMHQSTVVALDDALALKAAAISIRQQLPMADSIILATAHSRNAVIWTQDSHFEGLAGVQYISKRA